MEYSDLTEEQKKDWEVYLSECTDGEKELAKRFVPWKTYKDVRDKIDIGNRYIPMSFDEQKDGTFTMTCEKVNYENPMFGGHGVFGIDPNNLVEAD